ncbi:hypothetical protein TNCT_225511 [Trichonephila clavata]|uniref:Uncharacterized protein n=1 Tax=Trichonephila clavata TaxID=2740835 RepID=A0A8X6LBZ9_TRICU|nr:hypothetical protein TNCT_225511 [Trichonephila clavata]
MTKEDVMGYVIGKGLRVYPKTPQAYHTIRSYTENEKLEVYTYQLNEEKELKAVIPLICRPSKLWMHCLNWVPQSMTATS